MSSSNWKRVRKPLGRPPRYRPTPFPRSPTVRRAPHSNLSALRQCLHRDRSATTFPINMRYDKTSLRIVPVYIKRTCRHTKGRPRCNCSIRRGARRGTGRCIILCTTTGRAFIVIADICAVYICVRRVPHVWNSGRGEFPGVHRRPDATVGTQKLGVPLNRESVPESA